MPPTPSAPSISSAGTALAAEKEFFDDNGYLIVRRALDSAAVQALNREVDEIRRNVENRVWRGNHLFENDTTARAIFNIYDFSPTLRAFVHRPDVVARARLLLGTPLHLHHTKFMCKAAGVGTPQPPHQDYYYWQGKKANQVAVFVCVDPSTEANGCLRLVPGSHKFGLLPHHQEFHAVTKERHWVTTTPAELEGREVAFVAEPGDVLYFGSLTIHYSAANQSPQARRAVIFEYDELGNLEPSPGWGAPDPAVKWA